MESLLNMDDKKPEDTEVKEETKQQEAAQPEE